MKDLLADLQAYKISKVLLTVSLKCIRAAAHGFEVTNSFGYIKTGKENVGFE